MHLCTSCPSTNCPSRKLRLPGLIAALLIAIAIVLPSSALSDSLVIPDIANQPGTAPDTTPRPARAMTKEQVREEFGSPRQVVGPIGNPPITRWVYDDFVVTFENEYVIHSASKHKQ